MVYQAKLEELEQHVGILGNSPDPHFTSMKNMAPGTISALGTNNMHSNDGLWDAHQTEDPMDRKDKSKMHSMNNSDHNINLRGGSSMDDFVKQK